MILTNSKAKTMKISAAPFVVVVVGIVGFLLLRSGLLNQPNFKAPAPTSSAIEAKWGIRITQIGVTADGGMVDFRYQVLDADKALVMVENVNNLPTLVTETDQTVINSASLMSTKHNLHAGETYFLLYRNTRGAIQHGTYVTVKVGDLQLEHVLAK